MLVTTNAFSQQVIQQYSQYDWQDVAEQHFSGPARFARLQTIPNSNDSVALVEFDKATITHWHSHSHGQYLIVTEGEGRIQQWGKPVELIKKGDVIWCPPNIKHWHGASESQAMSHLVISPNFKDNRATWYEDEDASVPETSLKKELINIRQNTPLTNKQLMIIPIAFFSARGDLAQLKIALQQGLDSGLSVNELKEMFTHQYAYAGFPRALNGLQTLQALLLEHPEKDIPNTFNNTNYQPNNIDYYQLGTYTLNTITQKDNSNLLQNFDGFDYTLKAHLFGYLFSRDNLSIVNREIVTVSTLMSLETVPAQLYSHFTILNNLGLSKTELQRMILVTDSLDQSAAIKAKQVLDRLQDTSLD